MLLTKRQPCLRDVIAIFIQELHIRSENSSSPGKMEEEEDDISYEDEVGNYITYYVIVSYHFGGSR